MPTFMAYKLLEACREKGCPVCRLEQQSVVRYLDSQFYENVNSPPWRDHLRASLGFCHEHAWLGVDQRLGDALGYSIIYHDVINGTLKRLDKGGLVPSSPRRRASLLGPIPDAVRELIERARKALTPRKTCPVCKHREEALRNILSGLVAELGNSEMVAALEASDGLCLPHLGKALHQIRDLSAGEMLINIHREKLESLKAELAEFIRKNDYQVIKEGFGTEGDAWLRAIGMIAGSRKGR